MLRVVSDPDRSAATAQEAEDGRRLTVLVAGLQGALGAGLRELIAGDAELRIVGDESEPGDIAGLIAKHRPAAALVSRDALPSIAALRRLVLAHPETAIVLAVMRLSRKRDESLLAAGARIVVPVTMEPNELCAAMRLAARGLVGPPRPARGAAAASYGLLTVRETEVLELLTSGHSAREVAEELNLTVATVHTHRRHIYNKVGVHSRAELVSRAAQILDEEGSDSDSGG